MNFIEESFAIKKFLCATSVFLLGTLPQNVDAQSVLPDSSKPKMLFSEGGIMVVQTRNLQSNGGISCHLGISILETERTIVSFTQLNDKVEISLINHWSPSKYPPNGSYASVRVFGGEQLVGTGEGITDGTDILLESNLDMDELAHLFRSQDLITFEFFGDPKLGAGGRFGRHILVQTDPAEMQRISAAFDILLECAEE